MSATPTFRALSATALLLASAPAFGQSNVLYYTGNVGTTTSVTDLEASMYAIGVPEVHVTGLWPADLTDYHLVFLARPTVAFSAEQLDHLDEHFSTGGVLVLIGDAGSTGVDTLNAIAAALGAESTFNTSTWDSACTRTGTVFTDTEITAGFSEVGYAFSSGVDTAGTATVLVKGESGQDLIVEELGVVFAADLNLFVDTCSLPDGNTTFWQNLWFANSCDHDLDGYESIGCGGIDCDDSDAAVNPDAVEELCDGIDNNCDGIFEGDTDEDGVADICDICEGGDDNLDSDSDGTPDHCDECPFDDPPDTDGDGVCDTDDICPDGDDNIDGDGDGQPDFCDPCPVDNPNDSDFDGVCDVDDLCIGGDDSIDQDKDGIPTACDDCPFDAGNDADGDGVCGDVDICEGHDDATDTDLDGVPDGCDACPGGSDELDQDSDALPDGCDNCIFVPNADQLDGDGDGQGDACDPCPIDPNDDTDGDTVCDSDDQCSGFDDTLSSDQDGDGVLGCADDCNDLDPARSPLLEELCDGIDNNCDWVVPEDELDLDGDGVLGCDADCDDTNANASPFVSERCGDGVDNNCDGVVDEGCKATDDDGCSGCSGAGSTPVGGLWVAALMLWARRRATG